MYNCCPTVHESEAMLELSIVFDETSDDEMRHIWTVSFSLYVNFTLLFLFLTSRIQGVRAQATSNTEPKQHTKLDLLFALKDMRIVTGKIMPRMKKVSWHPNFCVQLRNGHESAQSQVLRDFFFTFSFA